MFLDSRNIYSWLRSNRLYIILVFFTGIHFLWRSLQVESSGKKTTTVWEVNVCSIEPLNPPYQLIDFDYHVLECRKLLKKWFVKRFNAFRRIFNLSSKSPPLHNIFFLDFIFYLTVTSFVSRRWKQLNTPVWYFSFFFNKKPAFSLPILLQKSYTVYKLCFVYSLSIFCYTFKKFFFLLDNGTELLLSTA